MVNHHRSDSRSFLTRQELPPQQGTLYGSYNIASAAIDGAAEQYPHGTVNETSSLGSDDETTSKTRRPTLNTLQLATIIFYSVSGGPFGIEESVRAAGPFYTLVGFALSPLVFSLPECLMTVELSAGGFKSAAAGCAWVEEAFGSFAGFMAGFLSWVGGATDNAIYPVLFLDYALQVFPSEDIDAHPTLRFALLTSLSVGLAYMNWLGLDFVGNMSLLVCFLAMSPFILLLIFGANKVDPHQWLELPASSSGVTLDDVANVSNDDDAAAGGLFPNVFVGGIMLRPFLNNLFWNFNSFDNAGCFAEDVSDPSTVLPRAMFVAFFMVALGYMVPLLVALGATDAPQEDWVDGYLATVVSDVCGSWLGKWLVFAAAISNLGQFQAELSSDALLLSGMSVRGFLPQFLGHRSPTTGTPTYAILVGTLVIVVMGVSNLDTLIEMLNFSYALSLLLEYAAFIKLRISKPYGTSPPR
jgi:amino acid transporter